MERMMINIDKVVVPKYMKNTKPKKYKVMGMEAYFKKEKHYYGNIVVDKKFRIIDGYIVYYTAKNVFNHTMVPIEVVTRMDRIKHFIRKIIRKVRR